MGFNFTQIMGNNAEENGKLKVMQETKKMVHTVSRLKKLNIPTYEGSGQTTHPSVTYINGGLGGYKYWMAHTPYPYADKTKENPSIVCSNDGENWINPPGLTNPIMDYPGSGWLADAELLYDPYYDKLRLWWTWFNGVDSVSYYTESEDGVVWSEHVETKINSVRAALGPVALTVQKEDLIIGWDSNGNAGQEAGTGYMRKYESTDGINWKRTEDATTIFGGTHWHNAVLADSGGFHFISAAHGMRDNSLGNKGCNLHYGYSMDGRVIVWDAIPIMLPQDNIRYFYRASIIPLSNNKNHYRIYTGYVTMTNEWYIGYFDVVIDNPTELWLNASQKARVERTILDQVEIRNDVEINSGLLTEFQNYTHKALIVWSSLDKPVTIRFVGDFGQASTLYYGKFTDGVPSAQQITIPIGMMYMPMFIDGNILPALNTRIPRKVTLGIKASDVPTDGKITVKLIAWN